MFIKTQELGVLKVLKSSRLQADKSRIIGMTRYGCRALSLTGDPA